MPLNANGSPLFKSARVSFDTVEWQNEANIDPGTLYEDSVPYNTS